MSISNIFSRRNTLLLILLLLVCAEIYFLTYKAEDLDSYKSPILLLIQSFAIAGIYWGIKTKGNGTKYDSCCKWRWLIWVQIMLFAALTIAAFLLLQPIVAAHPMRADDTSWSDVIPSIMQIVQHFLSREWAYKPIVFASHTVPPTYLPMMWLPYTLAEWMNIDYRYIAVLVYWLACLYYFINATGKSSTNTPVIVSLITPLLPLILWYAVADTDKGVIATTVESLTAGYYLFFAVALSKRKTVLIALALTCCLLSRYSIVLWLPLPIIVLFLSGNRKALLQVLAITVVLVLLIYWLPFLRHDSSIFFSGYKYYTGAAIGEWTTARDGGMWHLGNGYGFSAWMLRLHSTWQVPDIVSRYQKVHLAVCLGTTSILALIYIIRRKRIQYPYAFLLFSFKIYLAVFYAFIQVPYKYLMLVPVVVSSALVADALRYDTTVQTQNRLMT